MGIIVGFLISAIAILFLNYHNTEDPQFAAGLGPALSIIITFLQSNSSNIRFYGNTLYSFVDI